VAVAFAELAIGVGNFREAEAHAAEAVGLFEPIGNRTRLAGVRILQGQILSLQDQAGPALVRVAEAAALVADDACPLFMAEVLAARAEVLDDSGAGDVARQALAQAGELAAQCGADALVEDLRRCAEELREREFAGRLLGRYLDPRVVARVLARPERRVA